MTDFTGKKAVVIGGSGGIGKELSRLIAVSGASLTVHGGHAGTNFDRFISDLKSAAAQSGSSGKIDSFTAHLDSEDFDSVCKNILYRRLENADILCVCTGPFLQKTLETTELEEWHLTALLNYVLPGYCVSSVLKYMKKNCWGRILLFGGTRTYSINSFKTNAAYAGAKTAVCSLVRSVAQTYAACGITCNAVLPGFTDTEYLEDSTRRQLAGKIPGGKLVTASAVARFGMFLLGSPELNGVLLNADCGWNPEMQTGKC